MCGRFTLPDEAAVSRFLKIDRWNWNWPEPRDMANEIDPQAYHKFLFKKSPTAQITEDMRTLMPQHVDKSLLPNLPKSKSSKK
jgi:hypothetical protein